MPNRTIAPLIKDAIEFEIKLNPCTQAKLSNGVPLYFINDGAEEVAQLDFVFKAGNSYEKQSAIAGSANYLLKNGTSTKSAFEISEFFEYYGAFVNQSCYNETATVTLHCLSKYLKELLPVIREMITDSIFPEEEINIFKQNSIQRLSVNLLKCDFVANRLIDTYLYGSEHPYGRFTTEEGILSITRDGLIEFYEEYYVKGNCQIFAAGKLPADFQKLMDQNFGDLPIFEKKETILHPKQVASEKKYRITTVLNNKSPQIKYAAIVAAFARLPIILKEESGNYMTFVYQKNKMSVDYEIDLVYDETQISFIVIGKGFKFGGPIDFGNATKLRNIITAELRVDLDN